MITGVKLKLPEAAVLVVDDGSSDATAEHARAAGAEVATLPFNAGLGTALQTGYRFAHERGFDYFAHLDADGQHPPSELDKILEPVWAGGADLVVGSRFVADVQGQSSEFRSSRVRRFWIFALAKLLSAISGQRFTDITSGFRAGNRRAIDLFSELYQPDFGEIEALQTALGEGLVGQGGPGCDARARDRRLLPDRLPLVHVHVQVDDPDRRRPLPGQATVSSLPALAPLLAQQEAEVNLTARSRILAAAAALFFFLLVLELVRRRRLQERYTVLWFVLGLGMLAGAIFPALLELLADLLGVRDTNVALFALLLLLLLALAFESTITASRQGERITRLAQENALLRTRLAKLPGPESGERADRDSGYGWISSSAGWSAPWCWWRSRSASRSASS